MHNPIQLIYQRINWSIPYEILQLTFQHTLNHQYYSIEHAIHEEIIINKVLPECNIFAGNTKYIFLEEGYRLTTRPPQSGGYNAYLSDVMSKIVYRIPPDVREGKSIVNVVRVGLASDMGLWPGGILQNGCGSNGNTLQQLACDILNSKTGQATPRPSVKLIGGDMIELSFMSYPYQVVYNFVLECRLEHDGNFMNINNQAMLPLAELIECALKAYIYTKLTVRLDKGAIEGGYEIGKIREIIDEYKSAFEEYKDKLNAFVGASTMSHERMTSILRAIL
jgi:hypothetical protein